MTDMLLILQDVFENTQYLQELWFIGLFVIGFITLESDAGSKIIVSGFITLVIAFLMDIVVDIHNEVYIFSFAITIVGLGMLILKKRGYY